MVVNMYRECVCVCEGRTIKVITGSRAPKDRAGKGQTALLSRALSRYKLEASASRRKAAFDCNLDSFSVL